MPYQVNSKLCNEDEFSQDSKIEYGFFTNEKGSSLSCGIGGELTRSVNLYNPKDSDEIILANIQACIKEIPGVTRTFFMMPHYAKPQTRLVAITNDIRDGVEIRRDDYDKSGQMVHGNLKAIIQYLHQQVGHIKGLENKQVVKNFFVYSEDLLGFEADAIITQRDSEEKILLGGMSADAHPIVIIAKRAVAYLSGSHTSVCANILEKTLSTLFSRLDEQPENIHIVIGPGLGPNSYEFGSEAPEKFKMMDQKGQSIDLLAEPNPHLKKVINPKGEEKYLIQLANMMKSRAERMGVRRDRVLDMEIDTMGVDLYLENGQPNFEATSTEPITREKFLFFGARRYAKIVTNDMGAQNPGEYVNEGRHFAGIAISDSNVPSGKK